MKQKITTLIITTLTLFILSGCSLFTPFELKEETITMEYGDTLSEDVSTYITAPNYDEITYDYSEAYPGIGNYIPYPEGYDPGYDPNFVAFFTNPDGEKLTMNIEWVDTTPPTISQDYFDIYPGDNMRCQDFILPEDVYSDAGCPITSSNILYDGETSEIFDNLNNSYEEETPGEHTLSFILTDPWGNSSDHEVIINVHLDN